MTERKVGYARAATPEEINEQIERLKTAGCAEVFTDSKMVGSPLSRPGLKAALTALQSGDVLMVCNASRLSRSMEDKLRVIEELMFRGIEFEAIEEAEAARDLQHRINYAPDPSPDSPIRYAAFRLGELLIRYSRRGLVLPAPR